MPFIVAENLRGFFNSRPPLVVFMICLASFAIALITFAYLVRIRDLPNPDVTEDWNTVLTKFSGLKFCVHEGMLGEGTPEGNASNSQADTPANTGKKKIGEQHPTDLLQDTINKVKNKTSQLGGHSGGDSAVQKEPVSPASEPSPSRFVKHDAPLQDGKGMLSQALMLSTPAEGGGTGGDNAASSGAGHVEASTSGTTSSLPLNYTRVTLPLNMEISVSAELRAVSLQMLHLTAVIGGDFLNLKGHGRDQTMHISLSFPGNWSHENCEEWQSKQCTQYLVNTCVTFTGPASMFPPTQRPARSDVCERGVAPVTADSYVRNMSASSLSVSNTWCSGGSQLTAEFSFDDSLTVLLSQEDRSIINLHLMRTSYFLFVMVITLFCYAMVKGRPSKSKTYHVNYEKVSSAGP
ncbi:transmembrane protein 248 [Plakobranchus ocellatus]|uniref:Transmembrane protein 248 n=1 Tax=Plakobranchus ocellatus TaxID=259542 RepID=A0AAV4D0Z7_9GAST|nr:transmembrane protein 248 [Plakobranchus ocellatus]